MFQVKPLPDFDYSRKCQLLLNGRRLDEDEASATQYSDRRYVIHASDFQTSNQIAEHSLLELPPLEWGAPR